MASIPLIVKENFPNDQEYTYDRLIEQSAMLELRLRDGTWKKRECDGLQVVCDEMSTELGLMQLHLSDGSWVLCSCNPEKHLPLISGLASEGFGFTDDPDEKAFMQEIRDTARIWRSRIKKGLFNAERADELRAWARDVRHRIEAKDWRKEKDIEEQISYEDVPDSVRRLVEELEESGIDTANLMSLPEIEEDMAWRMVNFLSEKYSVPPPREIKFTDRCNPLYPNAAHIQRDVVTRDGVETRADLDYLVFCRGGVTAMAVAHEMSHYIDHFRGKIVADEAGANRFALKEVRNHLYTAKDEGKGYINVTENKLSGEKGMAKLDTTKGLEVGVGLTVAKLVDKYDYWFEAQFPGYAQSAKVAAGAILSYLSLTKRLPDGWASDIALFAGMELLVTELMKFIPGGTPTASAAVVATSAPVALPGAPGRAVITAASPYSRMWATPTRLTAGYPQIAQVDSKWIQVRV